MEAFQKEYAAIGADRRRPFIKSFLKKGTTEVGRDALEFAPDPLEKKRGGRLLEARAGQLGDRPKQKREHRENSSTGGGAEKKLDAIPRKESPRSPSFGHGNHFWEMQSLTRRHYSFI